MVVVLTVSAADRLFVNNQWVLIQTIESKLYKFVALTKLLGFLKKKETTHLEFGFKAFLHCMQLRGFKAFFKIADLLNIAILIDGIGL